MAQTHDDKVATLAALLRDEYQDWAADSKKRGANMPVSRTLSNMMTALLFRPTKSPEPPARGPATSCPPLVADLWGCVFATCSASDLARLARTCRAFRDAVAAGADLATQRFPAGYRGFLDDFGGATAHEIDVHRNLAMTQEQLLHAHGKGLLQLESLSVLPQFFDLMQREVVLHGKRLLQAFTAAGVFARPGFASSHKQLWFYEKTSAVVMDLVTLQAVLYKIHNMSSEEVAVVMSVPPDASKWPAHMDWDRSMDGDIVGNLITTLCDHRDLSLQDEWLNLGKTYEYGVMPRFMEYIRSAVTQPQSPLCNVMQRSFVLGSAEFFVMVSWADESSEAMRRRVSDFRRARKDTPGPGQRCRDRGHGHISCASIDEDAHSFFISGFLV